MNALLYRARGKAWIARKPRFFFHPRFWVGAVLLAGAAYLLFLQAQIPDQVFFTGDSGLKALLSQSLAAGEFRFDLRLPGAPWMRELWADGLFPYRPPFVYHIDGKDYITFPYTFSLVTAPFYALFGYRGLYVAPVLATVWVWLAFLSACKKLALRPAAVAAGAFHLIFATHLTLYSAMYWEHTLSVALAFAGLVLLIPARRETGPRFGRVLGAGLLTGLAVWFRPEQIFLMIFLAAAALAAMLKARGGLGWLRALPLGRLEVGLGRLGWVYLAAGAAALLLYGLSNWLIYHNLFGVHAVQVLEPRGLREMARVFLLNLKLMTVDESALLLYVPAALFGILYELLRWTRRRSGGRLGDEPGDPAGSRADWTILYLFGLAFVIGVAALVPEGAGGKQAGPRFLLLLAPVLVLPAAVGLDDLLRRRAWLPGGLARAGLALWVALGLLGVYMNEVRGVAFLNWAYGQGRDLIQDLRAHSDPVVAISAQHLGQVLQPALREDHFFFLVADEGQAARFSEALARQNQRRFTYLCYAIDCKLRRWIEDGIPIRRGGVRYELEILRTREYGRYLVLDMAVAPSREALP